MKTMIDYVMSKSIRGDCTCGSCFDAAAQPDQPKGHTADLTFFKVAATPEASADALRALVQEAMPNLLDGREHSYIEIGVEMGQDAALRLIGLGGVLGLWNVLSPDTVMPFLNQEERILLAQRGLVALKVVQAQEDVVYGNDA
jgi:hypothetical protein